MCTLLEDPTTDNCNCATASATDTVGYVHSVETCGTVDGPGLRYVLFLNGCPLRCMYCHNPDAQGKPHGEQKSPETVIEDVIKYRNFIKDGGLTISGGEPLMQPQFVEETFKLAKEAGLHTTLDTSGFLGHKASDELLDNTDLVLLDIKSWSPLTYKYVTGVCVDNTVKFAKRLEERGNKVWIRFVLVPGLTDNAKNVDGLAEFVATLGNVERVEILPFHKMGEHKYAAAGLDYKLKDTPTPTKGEVDAVQRIFAKHGVETFV
ncbi:pyruvate formate-lyase-activating protein [Coraliomargarita akajimensis]|uniref:Pyruvate formate-lyase-activating enzyme n=1 Tax=Coraliomargarita akajimensis (strain DSM 45221 / IAM 15411 / JCM 23193 / KCTC 12865 / 04OKA010-24) TaxID=583355 RepID=D5ELH4_CORAD|nr:pyruvate formate-lyase-activating protein [Coraliomargarita akajimensis]ADE55110.1 pyruvate formate-lyase activating enzyme [Coraliomargarita akajimensis DSM 45221]